FRRQGHKWVVPFFDWWKYPNRHENGCNAVRQKYHSEIIYPENEKKNLFVNRQNKMAITQSKNTLIFSFLQQFIWKQKYTHFFRKWRFPNFKTFFISYSGFLF